MTTSTNNTSNPGNIALQNPNQQPNPVVNTAGTGFATSVAPSYMAPWAYNSTPPYQYHNQYDPSYSMPINQQQNSSNDLKYLLEEFRKFQGSIEQRLTTIEQQPVIPLPIVLHNQEVQQAILNQHKVNLLPKDENETLISQLLVAFSLKKKENVSLFMDLLLFLGDITGKEPKYNWVKKLEFSPGELLIMSSTPHLFEDEGFSSIMIKNMEIFINYNTDYLRQFFSVINVHLKATNNLSLINERPLLPMVDKLKNNLQATTQKRFVFSKKKTLSKDGTLKNLNVDFKKLLKTCLYNNSQELLTAMHQIKFEALILYPIQNTNWIYNEFGSLSRFVEKFPLTVEYAKKIYEAKNVKKTEKQEKYEKTRKEKLTLNTTNSISVTNEGEKPID
jgi:hypothetical protein